MPSLSSVSAFDKLRSSLAFMKLSEKKMSGSASPVHEMLNVFRIRYDFLL